MRLAAAPQPSMDFQSRGPLPKYLHDSPEHQAKTLFATHYHELTELAERLPGAQNYQITAAEREGEVVFLHRLERGRASKSYGIQVARLPGCLLRCWPTRARCWRAWSAMSWTCLPKRMQLRRRLRSGLLKHTRRRRAPGRGIKNHRAWRTGAGPTCVSPS